MQRPEVPQGHFFWKLSNKVNKNAPNFRTCHVVSFVLDSYDGHVGEGTSGFLTTAR